MYIFNNKCNRKFIRGFFQNASFAILAFTAFAVDTENVWAQAGQYPGNKPIRLIVPFAPGGGTDLVARLLSQKLADAMGTTIVVDNRGGAGGSTGIELAVRAAPDGYTMIFGAASYATNAALYKLPYDPVKDITPVSLACLSGYLVSVHPSVPVKSTKELIAYAKQNPGKLNYGSSGVGGLAHLATELFAMMSEVKINHVPYKGTGPALSDLLGGHIQLVFGSVTATLPHVRANRLRGISLTTAKRSSELPDVPTIAETVPGYEAVLWYGVWGPKNVPANVVSRWNNEINTILKAADVKAQMVKQGLEPVGGAPAIFRKTLVTDIDKWTKVARQANLKINQ